MSDVVLPHNITAAIEQNGYVVLDVTKHKSLGMMALKYSSIALCTRGEAEIELNMEHLHVKAGDRMFTRNMMMLNLLESSSDLEVTLMLLDPKVAFNATVGISVNELESFAERPISHIDDEHVWNSALEMMHALGHMSHLPHITRVSEIANTLIRSVLLLLCGYDYAESRTRARSRTFTSADGYFRDFIDLVYQNVDSEHEVTFYASQLKITPKYLSEVCKMKSGHKAKEIISQILLARLKRDIIHTEKSIKQMTYDYHFADQSSLGKFFRKLTGMSPATYRRTAAGDNIAYLGDSQDDDSQEHNT